MRSKAISVNWRTGERSREGVLLAGVEDSRVAIVAAGREFFGTRGYAQTSLVDVARAANVTKGAVYHHFGSKQGLFQRVYEAVDLEAQLRARSEAVLDGKPLDVVRSVVSAYLDIALDPIVQRITLIDAPAVLGPLPAGPIHLQRGFTDFRDFISAAIDAGDVRPVDPDGMALVIRGACVQGGLYIAHAPDPIEARGQIGAAFDALISGLSTQTPTINDAL